jgi:hypothetical protein
MIPLPSGFGTLTAICALLAALRSEHPKARNPDTGLVSWDPRTIIYPLEIADLIGKITSGHSSLVPDELVGVCGEIETLICAWERNVTFKIVSHEEALAESPIVASWISFAQNAALGAYTYILEDGPELPKSSGSHAEERGEILEGMYTQGCTMIEESRIRADSGRAGGPGRILGLGSNAPALAMSLRG